MAQTQCQTALCTTLANQIEVNNVCVCNSNVGALLDLAGTSCVLTCPTIPTVQVRNFANTQCASACLANEISPAGRCVCAANAVINSAGSGCTLLPCPPT